MKIETQKEFWIEISKCEFDSDAILSVLMHVVASLLPTKEQIKERKIFTINVNRKIKEIEEEEKKYQEEIKNLKVDLNECNKINTK